MDVEAHRHFGINLSSRNYAFPADYVRDSDSAFEDLALVAAQRIVARGGFGSRAAVVAVEENQRLFFQVQLAQFVQYAPHGVVHGGGHAGIGSPFRIGNVREAVLVGLERLERRVHGVEGQVKEKGLILGAFDECGRFAGEGVGEVFLLFDRLAVADDGIDIRLAGHVGVGAAEEAEVIVESALVRAQSLLEADMPFPGHSGCIAQVLELFGQSLLIQRQAEIFGGEAFGAGIVLEAKAMLIAPRHQAGARRRADRMGGVAVGEAHAIGGQRVDVWRGDVLATLAAQVGVAQIVGENDDDVGLGRPGCFGGSGQTCQAQPGRRSRPGGLQEIAAIQLRWHDPVLSGIRIFLKRKQAVSGLS
ncbi:MAG: hypothetical protein BWZ10_03187 [candidate division BRC1 bacterium ADurb.BinA364]|nr:MAG: hypothetical protein BWZ10_03187 [candidate division BRC1 bacterium ADurb.BinA364]